MNTFSKTAVGGDGRNAVGARIARAITNGLLFLAYAGASLAGPIILVLAPVMWFSSAHSHAATWWAAGYYVPGAAFTIWALYWLREAHKDFRLKADKASATVVFLMAAGILLVPLWPLIGTILLIGMGPAKEGGNDKPDVLNDPTYNAYLGNTFHRSYFRD